MAADAGGVDEDALLRDVVEDLSPSRGEEADADADDAYGEPGTDFPAGAVVVAGFGDAASVRPAPAVPVGVELLPDEVVPDDGLPVPVPLAAPLALDALDVPEAGDIAAIADVAPEAAGFVLSVGFAVGLVVAVLGPEDDFAAADDGAAAVDGAAADEPAPVPGPLEALAPLEALVLEPGVVDGFAAPIPEAGPGDAEPAAGVAWVGFALDPLEVVLAEAEAADGDEVVEAVDPLLPPDFDPPLANAALDAAEVGVAGPAGLPAVLGDGESFGEPATGVSAGFAAAVTSLAFRSIVAVGRLPLPPEPDDLRG